MDVEHLSKLLPDLAQATRLEESALGVEAQARLVAVGDAGEYLFQAGLPASGEDRVEQRAAMAAAASALVDVHGDLGGAGVGAAVRVRGEGRPADDLAALLGDDHGMPGAVSREPDSLLVEGLRLGVERAGRAQDGLVVDRGDLGEVGFGRGAQNGHGQV